MLAVEEIGDGIFRSQAPIPEMPEPPVFYLIASPKGALIEPGPTAAAPYIQEAMARLGMASLSYIIPSHIHVDHGGGSGAMAGLFPGAQVIVHPRGARHLMAPQRLIESTILVWGQDFEKLLGPIIPVPEPRLKIAGDRENISLGDRDLEIIHAVGHSPHHIVILDHRTNGMFCGEALGLPGHLMPPVAPYSFEQDIYVSTIEALQRFELDRLYYSHGTVESNPAGCMARALETARLYGAMILESGRKGIPFDELVGLVGRDYSARFGRSIAEKDLQIAVGGYVIYYQTKDMIPRLPGQGQGP